MGILATPPPPVLFEEQDGSTKMSQDYNHHHHHHNQSIFTFSNDFDRSPPPQQQDHHIAQQIRREKLSVPGYEPPPPLVPIDHETESRSLQQYDTGVGMLSEMFNFPSSVSNPTELLESNVPPAFHRPSTAGTDWYGNHRQGMDQLGDLKNHHHHHPTAQIDSAAAMQLFLMNPQAPRSPSPSPSSSSHNHNQTPSTLHMLLPTPTSNSNLQGAFGQFTWPPPNNTEIGTGTVIEGQGLSLSLSSLQHLEAAKAEEFRMGDNGTGMMFYNNQGGININTAYNQYRNYGGGVGQNQSQGQGQQQVHVGFGSSSLGVVNVLRNSKYVKAAQELLEEFCSVGRGQFKKNKFARVGTTNPNTTQTSNGGGGSSSSSKDPNPPLSAADRIEHQRRKVKLLSMLDEVDRRYNHYCEQMQMVVNSFDLVMGFGSAIPYTALAQKAMSRHFRCLKDAISAQLKHSCELLGEKDAGTSGVTKGETPRLKLLEQSLRQQRAFHQMGMMEQEAWRPQRGLPERSVNILRAWLFEHFLHPYPSDADKHLLARQTGLSRSQVSNWFINARVRLWKPMVEEMYQKESKEETTEEDEDDERETRNNNIININPPLSSTSTSTAQTPTPTPTLSSSTPTSTKSTTPTQPTANIIRSHINYPENDPSLLPINTHCFSSKHGSHSAYTATMPPVSPPYDHAEFCRRSIANHDNYGTTANADVVGQTLISFGTTTGDVSLTLGLRHAGNLPDNGNFSVREFGGC